MKKKIIQLLPLLFFLFAVGELSAQVAGGTYTIPGNYNTLAEAISDLNNKGIGGHVIINMIPGNPEIAPAGGYKLGSATLNASINSNRSITIRGNGNTLTAPQCTGCAASTIRGVFLIIGTDNVTIDSLNIQENSLNTTVNTQMNWGYALVKLDATDGCQNVTIQKCTIRMALTQTNALGAGIYSGNHLSTSTSALTLSSVSGTNSNNQFIGNNITARRGILLNGFNAPVASRPTLYDQNNKISRNELRFGVSAANASFVSAGVNVQYQNELQVINNRFSNEDGATIIGNSPIYGVYFNTTDHVNFTCSENIFEFSQAHNTAGTYAVYSLIQGKGTITIKDNILRNLNYTHNSGNSGEGVFVYQANVVYNIDMTGNEVINNTGLKKSNVFYMFRYGGYYDNLTDTSKGRIVGNRLVNFERATGSSGSLVVNFVSIETNNVKLRGKFDISDNVISDVTIGSGSFKGIGVGGYEFEGGYGHDFDITNNTFTRISSAGNFTDWIIAGGIEYGPVSGVNILIRDNVISDITRDGGGFRGIVFGQWQKDFDDWGTTLSPPWPGSITYCYNNIITKVSVLNSLDDGESTGGAVGFLVRGGTSYVYNNFITDLMHNLRIVGMDLSTYWKSGIGPSTVAFHPKNFVYNNTIKVGDGPGLSGTSAIGIIYNQIHDTTIIRNNIININAKAGTFNHVACIKSIYAYATYHDKLTIGGPGITPPNGAQLNNNIYYVPAAPNTFIYVEDSVNHTGNAFLRNGFGIGGLAEDPARHIFNDPGFNTLCSGYKPFIGGGRELSSFWENNLTPASVAGTYRPSGASFAKSNAAQIVNPPITTDFFGMNRGTTPDIGASQFTGSVPTGTPPIITITQHMPLVTYCTDVASVSAHITAAGGLNTTTGTAPRLYYKKHSEANAFGSYPAQNNASFNGWKYVEAIGTPPNFVFNLDYSKLTSPIAAGDSITYFVVAQDNAATPNVAVNTAGFTTGCSLPSVNLDPSIGATTAVPVSRGYRILPVPTMTITAGQAQYCMNGVAHLKLASLPQAATVQWQEDRGTGNTWYDIPGASGVDYVSGTLISDNNYRAVIRCNGVVVATSNIVPITISSTPTPTSVFPGNRCGPGEVTLRASSSGNSIIWYETLTGGAALHKGDTFTTPPIATSTDYYVSSYNALVSGMHVGEKNPGSLNASTAKYGLRFDVLNSFILDSVTIYPATGSLGDLYIKIMDASGAVLQSKKIDASQLQLNVANRIYLGFHVSPGNDQELVMDGPNGIISTFRTQSSGVGFPQEAQGIVTIKEGVGNAPHIWYYFFDWVISVGCESATRTPVRAVINPAPAISISATSTVICQGETTTLQVTSGNTGYTFDWTPGNLNGASVAVSPTTTTVYHVAARDNSGGAFNGCSQSDSIEITVNPSPISLFNHSGNTSFCYGEDSVLLQAGASASQYQWLLNGILISGATNPDYLARDSGSYQLVMQDGSCADTSGELVLTIFSLPNPVIIANGNLLSTDKPYSSYQWYWNGQAIPGATAASYNAFQDGKYSVSVEDWNGCKAMADDLEMTVGVADYAKGALGIKVYPNPVSTNVYVEALIPVELELTGIDGRTVIPPSFKNQLNLTELADGIYLLKIKDESGKVLAIEKMIKSIQ